MANLMVTVSDRGDEQRLREEDGMVNNLQSFLDVLEGMHVRGAFLYRAVLCHGFAGFRFLESFLSFS